MSKTELPKTVTPEEAVSKVLELLTERRISWYIQNHEAVRRAFGTALTYLGLTPVARSSEDFLTGETTNLIALNRKERQ